MPEGIHPFLVNYTKAVLTEAASTLGIEVKSGDTKGAIINKLNSHPDTVAMEAAVYAAAGE